MSAVDVVAAGFLLSGSVLVALGAFGLVRFPDVLTRMHAATKAATVGVIAATVAAVLEAGALEGILALILVVALLFLSGPLGMSLLARAAYHDPETPLAPPTRRLDPSVQQETAPAAVPGSGTSRVLALWLFGVWVALFGSVAPNVVLGGLAVSGLVAVAFRHLAPRWPRAFAHPIAAGRFTVFFVGQMLVSTWGVIVALRRRPEALRPAVIDVRLRVYTRTEVTLLMNSISFTPGTVALELHDRRLFVHVLDAEGPDRVVADIQRMEDRIMDMFGTTVERYG